MATITAASPSATQVENSATSFVTHFNVNGSLTDEARVRVRLEGWGANEDDYSFSVSQDVTVMVGSSVTPVPAAVGVDGYITLPAGTTKILVSVKLLADGLAEQPEMLAVILEQGTDPLTMSQLQDSYWLSSVVTITDPATGQPSGPASTNGDDDVTVAGSFNGGTGNDSITGDSGADTLSGGDGNDTITGMGGADSLAGEEGNDDLAGGDGNDAMTGGNGEDLLSGEAGNDSLNGGNGQDTLSGGADADTLDGSNGQDELDGGDGADVLFGGLDADTLIGGAGIDSMDGGAGDDLFVIESGEYVAAGAGPTPNPGETIIGGDGFDVVETKAALDRMSAFDVELVRATGSNPLNIDAQLVPVGIAIRLEGNSADNRIDGNGAANFISGGEGNDTLNGGNGSDTLAGGSGNDQLDGGAGADTFLYESGGTATTGDTVDGGTGFDTILIAFVPASGNAELPSVKAGTVIEAIRVSNALDAASRVDLKASGVIQLDGHDGVNYITAEGSFNNVINAMGGNDTVVAGDGNDTVNAGNGSDSVDGGSGNDVISGGDGADWLKGGDGTDRLDGGSGNDTIQGGSGNDSIALGTGVDVIKFETTGNGVDSITGFLGSSGDVLAFPNLSYAGFSSSPNSLGVDSSTGNVVTAFLGKVDTSVAIALSADVVSANTATAIQAAFRGSSQIEQHSFQNRVLILDAGSEVRIFMVNNPTTAVNDITVTHLATLVGVNDITPANNMASADTFTSVNFTFNG